MNGKERIKALLEGKVIDRSPIAGWYHMPFSDLDPNTFAEATIRSTDEHHWDFIKVMTNGHFYTQAYGGEIEFSKIPENWFGTIRRYPIRTAEDAASLPVLSIDNPVWQRELKVVRKLKAC